MKTILIGSVAAGVSAAQRLDPSAQLTVYERGAFLSCGSCGLPYFLAHPSESLGDAIASKEAQLNAQGIEYHRRHEVRRVDSARKEIEVCELDTGRVFTDRYDRLVFATGSQNVVPQVAGAEKMGVHTLKTVDDVIFLREYIKTPYVRDIVILGGSYAGLEIAKAFLERNRSVRIIEKEARLLPSFDAEIADMIRDKLVSMGVQLSLGEAVRGFTGRTYVESVQTARGSYPCDLCICAMGVKPNTALLASLGAQLDTDGAVLIDRGFATSVPDVYAVGDCARLRDGCQSTSSLHVCGLEIARTGLTEADARRAGRSVRSVVVTGNDRPGIVPHPKQVTLKLVYDGASKQLVGAQGWGEKNVVSRINAIAVAIAAGMTTDQLANVDFAYSSAVSSVWDPVQMACSAAR